jgi:hypothetical protein
MSLDRDLTDLQAALPPDHRLYRVEFYGAFDGGWVNCEVRYYPDGPSLDNGQRRMDFGQTAETALAAVIESFKR